MSSPDRPPTEPSAEGASPAPGRRREEPRPAWLTWLAVVVAVLVTVGVLVLLWQGVRFVMGVDVPAAHLLNQTDGIVVVERQRFVDDEMRWEVVGQIAPGDELRIGIGCAERLPVRALDHTTGDEVAATELDLDEDCEGAWVIEE